MMDFTPREIIAAAVGILLGVAMQTPGACRRGCCAVKKDPGLPPRKPHTMMESDMAACCRLAKKEGLAEEALHAELADHSIEAHLRRQRILAPGERLGPC